MQMELVTLSNPMQCIACESEIPAGQQAYVKRIVIASMSGSPSIEEVLKHGQQITHAVCKSCWETEEG